MMGLGCLLDLCGFEKAGRAGGLAKEEFRMETKEVKEIETTRSGQEACGLYHGIVCGGMHSKKPPAIIISSLLVLLLAASLIAQCPSIQASPLAVPHAHRPRRPRASLSPFLFGTPSIPARHAASSPPPPSPPRPRPRPPPPPPRSANPRLSLLPRRGAILQQDPASGRENHGSSYPGHRTQ